MESVIHDMVMNMDGKVIARIVAVVAAVLVLLSFVAGWLMCNYALKPKYHGQDVGMTGKTIDERYPGVISQWYEPLHEAGVFKDTVITGERGYRLHAVYAPAAHPESAAGTAVIIHGYTNNHLSFANLSRMYRDSLNYNILVPDLHYHGMSEGRAIQMAWLDRLDVLKWIDVAHNIWHDDFMLVTGVSMGGATTMMVSGEPLPSYVGAFIEDCGYSSVWEQFAHNLKQQFHLPPFPVLHCADIICKLRYGWSFKEASSLGQLASCDRPMLFIHGDADDYVPTSMVYENYDAKTSGYKELWIARGSAHADAWKDHPEEYQRVVSSFLDKVRLLR